MRLKWQHGDMGDVDLFTDGRMAGWVGGQAYPYKVHIVHRISPDRMPCEDAEYVTLRQAMRALKETVVILLIGGEHEAWLETDQLR